MNDPDERARTAGEPLRTRRTAKTMNRHHAIPIVLALLFVPASVAADDLTGAESFLCTAAQGTACYDDGGCETLPPWELNIPQFIEVDLAARTLSTTAASGQNRSTPIKNLEREDGLIILQGYENGRAFSFVIAEEDGMASIAVARDGLGVSVFGACTPLPPSSGGSNGKKE